MGLSLKNYKKTVGMIKNVVKVAKSKNESFGTNILGEAIIIEALKRMETEKLEQVRYIINCIIKERKEQKYNNVIL